MHLPLRTLLLTTLCGTALLGSRLHAQTLHASSRFDSDLEGWTAFDARSPGEFGYAASGGNPGGYIRGVDVTAAGTAALAPAAFLGNWDALGITRLSYDHSVFSVGAGICGFGNYNVLISGPGGSATWIATLPVTGVTPWITIDVPVEERVWTVTSGDWASLLQDVTELRIPLETVCNSSNQNRDINGIDNVLLFAERCQQDLGFAGPGTVTATLCGSGLRAGEASAYRILGAPANAAGVLLVSLAGQPNVPFLGGTLVSFGGFLGDVVLTSTPQGTVTLPIVGSTGSADLVLQCGFLDPSQPQSVALSNAVLGAFGR